MFYDLNVQRPETVEKLSAILIKLKELRYHVVAITTELTEEMLLSEGGNKKKNDKKSSQLEKLLTPVDVNLFSHMKLKILNRLNITVENPDTFHRIRQCKQVKNFDIISYLPTSDKALQVLPTLTDFDILSYNPNIDNPPIKLNRKLYTQMVRKGIFMEIPYSPIVMDSTMRKYCILAAHRYNGVGKSKNIILTSAGSEPFHFVTPQDAIHLGHLLGLTEEQSRFAIQRHCADLIFKARPRRRGKMTMDVTWNDQPLKVDSDLYSDEESNLSSEEGRGIPVPLKKKKIDDGEDFITITS